MTGIIIGVVATDLAALINSVTDTYHGTPTPTAGAQEQHDALLRLTAFRTDVAALLGVSGTDPDARLLDALRQALTGQRREWQCPVCQEWIAGVHMLCPNCTSEQATNTTASGEERTGRFEPVAEPARCTAHGEPACGLCSLNPCEAASIADGGCTTYQDTGMHWTHCPNRVVKVTGAGAWIMANDEVIPPPDNAPAHALNEDPKPLTPEMVADILSLVDVEVHPDYVRGAWDPQQWVTAVEWASAVHLDASDNIGVDIPERPGFLPAAKHPAQEGDIAHVQ